jgi:hypothetical protein
VPGLSLDSADYELRWPRELFLRELTALRAHREERGSRLVRWAAVEAVQRVPGHTRLGRVRDQVATRRGHNIGVVAAARQLIVLVFYGLRDRHIRRLPPRTRAA